MPVPRRPRSVRQFINEKSVLRDLHTTIDFQIRLTELISSLLPAPLNAHIVSAQIQQTELLIHTDAPTWAARLRFLATPLLQQVRSDYPNINSMKVRIIYPDRKSKTVKKAATYSRFAADIIHKNAENTKDEALKRALEQLSHTIRKKARS